MSACYGGWPRRREAGARGERVSCCHVLRLWQYLPPVAPYPSFRPHGVGHPPTKRGSRKLEKPRVYPGNGYLDLVSLVLVVFPWSFLDITRAMKAEQCSLAQLMYTQDIQPAYFLNSSRLYVAVRCFAVSYTKRNCPSLHSDSQIACLVRTRSNDRIIWRGPSQIGHTCNRKRVPESFRRRRGFSRR